MDLIFGADNIDRRVADVECLLREWRVKEADSPPDRVLVEDLSVRMLITASRSVAHTLDAVG